MHLSEGMEASHEADMSFESAVMFNMESEKSHLINSRSSRKRLNHDYTQSEDSIDESCDIEQFKQEIQIKYILSSANKFYSFPFSLKVLEYDSDEELEELRDVTEYVLISQNTQSVNTNKLKDRFKVKDRKKEQPKRAEAIKTTTLIQNIKNHKDELLSCLQAVRGRKLTREREVSDDKVKKKSGEKQKYGTIIQMLENESAFNQRLMTEPDEFYLQKLKNRKR